MWENQGLIGYKVEVKTLGDKITDKDLGYCEIATVWKIWSSWPIRWSRIDLSALVVIMKEFKGLTATAFLVWKENFVFASLGKHLHDCIISWLLNALSNLNLCFSYTCSPIHNNPKIGFILSTHKNILQ